MSAADAHGAGAAGRNRVGSSSTWASNRRPTTSRRRRTPRRIRATRSRCGGAPTAASRSCSRTRRPRKSRARSSRAQPSGRRTRPSTARRRWAASRRGVPRVREPPRRLLGRGDAGAWVPPGGRPTGERGHRHLRPDARPRPGRGPAVTRPGPRRRRDVGAAVPDLRVHAASSRVERTAPRALRLSQCPGRTQAAGRRGTVRGRGPTLSVVRRIGAPARLPLRCRSGERGRGRR